jgi:hypothetical protein
MTTDAHLEDCKRLPWYPADIDEARTLMGFALLVEQTVQKQQGSGAAVLACRDATRLYSDILATFEGAQ